MNKPNCAWGFTAEPDFARICRELAAQGATVGRVTMKGSEPVTLVRRGSDPDRLGLKKGKGATVVWGAPDWLVIQGDHVDALLKPPPSPVKVEGFGIPPKAAAPAPVAEPAPQPRFGIFCGDGQRSVSFPQTFDQQAAAQAYLNALPAGHVRDNWYCVRQLPDVPARSRT